MKNHFNTLIAICLFSFGMAAFAGPKAGRLEITGKSEFLLNPISEVEYDFDDDSSLESEESEYDLELGLNYYITDNFSVGGGFGYEYRESETKAYNAAGTLTQDDEETESMSSVYLRADYYFLTSGQWIPYAGVHVGYLFGSIEEKDNLAATKVEVDLSGYMYGAQVGTKYFITDSIALDLSLRYSKLSLEGSVDTGASLDFDTDGTELEAAIGFSVYF